MVTKLISLEKDISRRSSFYCKWQELVTEVIWTPAIDGRNPEQVQKTMELLKISEIGELPRSYSGHRGELSPGELGCTLSHLIAIDEFLATKNKFLFILEDDAEPVDLNKINRIVEAIQEYDFDLFLLGFRKNVKPDGIVQNLIWKTLFILRIAKPRFDFDRFLLDSLASWKSRRHPTSRASKTAVYSSGFHYGTYGYILNRRAALELKHLLRTLRLRSDEAISFANQSMRLKVITSQEPLVRVNSDFESNIRDKSAQAESFMAHGN